MSTIKDVAREAKVSVATVSRFINDKGYVSKETQIKIAEAIELLNYTPNSIARSLYSKETKTIGLIIPDITNPFFPELAAAVERSAREYGYSIILCNTNENVDKENYYIDLFKQKLVDGILISTLNSDLESLKQEEIPVVAIDREIDKNITTVVSNNYEGSKIATKFLIDKGASQIAHIRGPRHIVSANERCRGFVDEMKQNNLEYIVEDCGYDLDIAQKVAKDFFEKNTHINGIFCSNDMIAVGFLKEALKRNIAVPEQLQIIGFDGISLGRVTYPELTTMAQDISGLGNKSINLLVNIIRNKSVPSKQYFLSTFLMERKSTL